MIKRWVNEVQQAVNSNSVMVRYHALGLLYQIKKSDRLAVTRLINQLMNVGLRSQYAECMLIQIAGKLIEEADEDGGDRIPLRSLETGLERLTRRCFMPTWKETTMVGNEREPKTGESFNPFVHFVAQILLEVARAIFSCTRTTAPAGGEGLIKLVPSVVWSIRLVLTNPRPTPRFGAIQILDQVSLTHPKVMTACREDLWSLTTDANKSIAAMALSVLLKAGNELVVEYLVLWIPTMGEIPDEIKVVVLKVVRLVCHKFPRIHSIFMDVLAAMFKEKGIAGFVSFIWEKCHQFEEPLILQVLNSEDRSPKQLSR